MNARQVSVVIPVKDDPRVEACLASILAACPPGLDLRLIVVDNGSGPAFSEWLDARCTGRVTLLRDPVPGVYRARNLGVDHAHGEAIFFTDADCIAHPGWFEAGLAALDAGADLAQGFSGSLRSDRISRLIQRRYEARFRRLPAGAPTETDTRHLAVRRTVFERLRFDERFRRVGDTALGLHAERLGFRVAYTPSMRVDHHHDRDLRTFAAQQVCHGWGAQRLMLESPGLPWHGGHLGRVARLAPRLARVPAGRLVARTLQQASLSAAGALQWAAPTQPFGVAAAALAVIDKAALLAGHLSYRPGDPEPSPSQLLGRRLPRD